MHFVDTPVLIVGAGPTGLTAGLFLSRAGIDHCIIDRRSGPQRAPAAHVINARSFEIWRQAGVDMERLLAMAKDPADAGAVFFVTQLGGNVLGRLPFERQGDDVLAVTPTPLRNLSQHRLEPLLVDAVARAGTGPRYRHQWEGSTETDGGVRSRVRDLDGGDVYEIRSRYVIAADGAGSPVRKSLGITPIGPDRIQSFVMIHFEANLRALVRDCPGVLYFVMNPSCMGTLVAHDIDREWVFMHGWDPDAESLERYDAPRCEAIVRRALIDCDAPLAIRTVSSWVMTSQTAERYRAGRTFLAGDAAHRFPPTGGLGLNTGVQDAHNLAWKIAAVEHGWAGARLLDSYEQERQPIAQYNAEQSLHNAARLMAVPSAVGFSGDLEQSREQFRELLVDSARRRGVAAAIAEQAEHFDMLGLQLGYTYEIGAVIADGTPRPAGANPVRDFVPSSRPGSRLPHSWVCSNDRRTSTLDLVSVTGFTLLVGRNGAAWTDAAERLGVPVRSHAIGVDVADPARWWSQVADMGDDGALLVRPDQHVAFRSRHGVADPDALLADTVRALLR